MPYSDLREYLAKLEKEAELARVRKEVDPKFEVGAVCKTGHERGRKALFFERVRGSSMPVVTELLTTFKRIAMALETDQADLFTEVVERTKKSIEPTVVRDGPCKEIIFKGKDVDLNRLPWITWNKTEHAPYLTAGLVIVRDPEFGRNMGVYRMMYANRNQTFLRLSPGHHGYEYYKRAELRGEKKLEVAVAIGTDPTVFLASQFVPGIDVDEFTIAGALRKAPVELVRCETVDLEVPATAEIVLEGYVDIPPELGDEGPYGEFCGYSVGKVFRERLWNIQCVTMRRNPIYQGFYLCKGINEEGVIKSLTVSVQIYNELKPGHPAIKRVHCSEAGIGIFHCFIQIDERLKRPGMVNNILASAVGVKGGRVKHVFVFDDDIDITNSEEVEWAIATRVQADKDIFIIPNSFGLRLDPSASSEGVTAKLFVDATKSKDFRSEGLVLPPPDVWERVKKNWDGYFAS
ncbi:MAG: UbiD family decarboxylase [Deltaproteobacteria bacterium]|nr:UbiD family decarboxylase [Deltaproteobacteria bacterium]